VTPVEISPAEKAWKFTQFIDKHGTILDKSSNPVHSILEMEYSKAVAGKHKAELVLHANFRVMSAAQGNGSFRIEVKLNKKTVLKAHGGFTGTPHNVTVKTYVSGEWEKLLSQV
jgi:hypothetical protein